MPHTSFTYDLDFGCELQEALDFCEKLGYKVVSFKEYGPAGGNPNLVIKFNDVFHFLKFLHERYIDDDDRGMPDVDMLIEEIAMHLPNIPVRAFRQL